MRSHPNSIRVNGQLVNPPDRKPLPYEDTMHSIRVNGELIHPPPAKKTFAPTVAVVEPAPSLSPVSTEAQSVGTHETGPGWRVRKNWRVL